MMTVVETKGIKTHSSTLVLIVKHSESSIWFVSPQGQVICRMGCQSLAGGSAQAEWLSPQHDPSSFPSEAAHWMLGLIRGDEAHQSGGYLGGGGGGYGWPRLCLSVYGERCMWFHASDILKAPPQCVCVCGLRTQGLLWRVYLTDSNIGSELMPPLITTLDNILFYHTIQVCFPIW